MLALNIIERFKKERPDAKMLAMIIAGSHFFNLNSENSDQDFRGIFMAMDETAKGEITFKSNTNNNTKNTAYDYDCTFYSLNKYLTLLKSGDFNMIEMLYAPTDKIYIDSPEYQLLREIRESIIPSDISAFLGFIKKEYKRFGVDHNHLGIQLNFIKFLKQFPSHHYLKDYWNEIIRYSEDPDSFVKISKTMNVNKELPALVVAKRMFQSTVRISYVLEALEYNISHYGDRRKKQANAGVEYKGLYHAQRLIFEAFDLVKRGRLSFPFDTERHNYLKSIKEGTVDPDVLFSGIDAGVAELYRLEKNIRSNEKSVEPLIEKIRWKMYTSLEISEMIKKFKIN